MRYLFISAVLLSAMILGCSSATDIPKQSKFPKPPSSEESGLLDKAVALHDEGKYEEASNLYEQILNRNPDNILAVYEMAYTQYAAGNLEKSLSYVLKGLEYESPYLADLYMMGGNALDYMGKKENALSFYQEAVKHDPENFMIRYNIGITHYKKGEYAEAALNFSEAALLNPKHGSSLIALADINLKGAETMRAYLLTLKFLMIEPKTQRSNSAFEILNEIIKGSVTKSADNSYNIQMNSAGKDSPYRTLEFMYKLAIASRTLKENEKKTEIQSRLYEFNLILGMIGKNEKPESGLDALLFNYFSQLAKSNNAEAFVYYTHQNSGLPGTDEWIKNNQSKINTLLEWDNNYVFSNKTGN